jgi:hypothetical protein
MKTVKKLLLRAALLAALLAALCCTAFAVENHQVSSRAELLELLSSQLEARAANFTVTYDGDYLNLVDQLKGSDVGLLARDMAASEPNTDGSGPDYNMLNLETGAAGVLENKLYFSFTYLTTQAQEDELDAACAKILAGLRLDGLSDYAKVREIYEYVGTNFVYDHSLKIFSPYFGLKTNSMVCQGYALLMYKLLWQCGIPNRIITGTGGAEPHGWNIVKLDGAWYNLDVTWDAAQRVGEAMQWNFFLRGSGSFPGHTRADSFDTAAYRAACPMSAQDYPCTRIVLSVKGEETQSLLVRLSTGTVQLAASVPGCTFTSTDPSVVSVSKDGLLTVHKLGQCSIIARTSDRSLVPGMLPVQTVDLSACSSWASDRVNSYYLRGLLPAAFCEKYQETITRAELAELLCDLFAKETDLSGLDSAASFTDISDSDYADAINICVGLGLFEGTGGGKFSPDRLLTREQAAKILVKAMEKLTGEELAPSKLSYADAAKISKWAASYVSEATDAGILRGASQNRFNPSAGMTREQIYVILDRLCGMAETKKAAA